MKAQGNVRTTDTNLKGAAAVAASGGRMTFTKAAGLGKEMVRNLDGVKKNYKMQAKADRRAAALDRAAGL
jgi:hypothetical protein